MSVNEFKRIIKMLKERTEHRELYDTRKRIHDMYEKFRKELDSFKEQGWE